MAKVGHVKSLTNKQNNCGLKRHVPTYYKVQTEVKEQVKRKENLKWLARYHHWMGTSIPSELFVIVSTDVTFDSCRVSGSYNWLKLHFALYFGQGFLYDL